MSDIETIEPVDPSDALANLDTAAEEAYVSSIPQITNPSDRKKLRRLLDDIMVLNSAIDIKKTEKKVILDDIKAQFQITPAFSNQLVKILEAKTNMEEIAAKTKDLERLHHDIIATQASTAAQFGKYAPAEPSDEPIARFDKSDVAAAVEEAQQDE